MSALLSFTAAFDGALIARLGNEVHVCNYIRQRLRLMGIPIEGSVLIKGVTHGSLKIWRQDGFENYEWQDEDLDGPTSVANPTAAVEFDWRGLKQPVDEIHQGTKLMARLREAGIPAIGAHLLRGVQRGTLTCSVHYRNDRLVHVYEWEEEDL